MRELLSKCGMNCGNCPSYRENIDTDEDRRRCSDGWHRYHGFRITPARIRLCDGCQTPDADKPTRYLNCYVRKCAVKNDVATCAHCSEYPCEDVPTVSMPADSRQAICERLGSPIPETDYLTFIEPYEGIKHLDALRATLTPADIVPMATVSVRPRVAAFPDEMERPAEEREALHALYHILSNIGCADDVSYARQHALKKNRTYLLKVLWAFGLHGEWESPAGDLLTLAGADYLAQGVNSYFSTLQNGIEKLRGYGIECAHVPAQEDGWLTPTGALRKKGWSLTMTMRDSVGGRPALAALQTHVQELNRRHGKTAFRYFSRADMRVLAG